VRIWAEVKDFEPTDLISPKEARKLERFVLFAVNASAEALKDSGLRDFDPTRVAILFGSAIGGIPGLMEQHDILRDRGPDRVSPSFIPNVLVDTASGQIAITLGIKGPNYAVVSACATGSHAIGEAAELIKRGDADAAIAGGSESCVHPIILAGFTAMRGLAAEDEHPPRASRPFDATRAGSSAPRAPAPCCSRTGSTPSGAGRGSTARCSATAPQTTRTTSHSRSRRRPASPR